MSSVSGIRLPGLATGMDTETMVKEMLTGEQNKIDKAKQKEQTLKWQQEIYREVINDVKGFNDKYFSFTSKDSILISSAWNTLNINSSNSNVITATGSAGANTVNYKFEVSKLATSGKASSTTAKGGKIEKNSELKDLGLGVGTTEFSIRYGDKDNEVSSKITIRTEDKYKVDEKGNFVYEKDKDGNNKLDESGQPIKIVEEPADTIDTLIKKINNASDGNIKASYSEMTGAFTIESTKTGSNNGFTIVGSDGKTSSDALDFLELSGKDAKSGKFLGTDSEVKVSSLDDKFSKELVNSGNSFAIDGITYNLHGITQAGETVEITSKQDVQPVVDKMKAFVEDYNKIMDKVYDTLIQKPNREYPPLTESQKKDMDEDEIKKWEEKAKKGLLRNDSDMRKFMDDMQKSIFGDNMQILNEMGLKSHENYNKRGQISLDETKFIKTLENNSDKVYDMLAKGSSSVMENMKSTIGKYVGNSSSIFAKKAGLDKTASATNNFYSEQLKKQADAIKELQRKMNNKENDLYKKFGLLESNMNKFNSQMNYFAQM
ncbi:flagellar filament capping protein FliD [Terrisporobacter petrolearius]|uniref:flagellar filament capping protein FliD n=1 Tax=Terrisporobacter petrolearius TaxID=1460447 RepID=UPI001D163EF9|nr:flagellar filament capping protein FliD [Terrisporobacter petrolearius]MCC3862831.1 flagellar filament capping protein FliD [Terrisporobacter petrolearius]